MVWNYSVLTYTISKLCSLCHLSFERHLISSFHLRSALRMGRSLYSRWNQILYQVSSSGGKWVSVEIKAHQTKHIFKPRTNGKMSKITKAVVCFVYICITSIFSGSFLVFCDFTAQRVLEGLVTNPAEIQWELCLSILQMSLKTLVYNVENLPSYMFDPIMDPGDKEKKKNLIP